ncbi:MAG: hypothetical protein Q7J60_03590, partial [Bradyrhizobium sp.]|nr:hypothetical protein [Bradyrhizobium sp.]
RREGRSVSAEPVCSCAFVLCEFAHETAGAARTRSSLRPLSRGHGNLKATSGGTRREIVKPCLSTFPNNNAGLKPREKTNDVAFLLSGQFTDSLKQFFSIIPSFGVRAV